MLFRSVLRHERFLRGFGFVFKRVAEIKSGVGGKFAEGFYFSFAGVERGFDVVHIKFIGVHAFAKAGVDTNKFDVNYVKAALDTCKGKIKTFSELPAYAGFYFRDTFEYDAEAAKKAFVPENKPRLEKLRDAFAKLPTFDAATIEATLKATAAELGGKVGILIHPTRLATTGQPHGPSLYHLLEVLGKEKTLGRIERAMGSFNS